MTLSTRNLNALPDIDGLRRLAQSLATLDAILSPEWEYRYYSFNRAWADGEMMASMRNGSGDRWFALFCAAGAALHGRAHDVAQAGHGRREPGIFGRLPAAFHDNLLHEPAFTTHESTFCIWRLEHDARWSSGAAESAAGDDAAGLLEILDGQPARYVAFAGSYHERDLEPDDVAAIYAHRPLTPALVRRLNPDVDLAALADDLDEIGYPVESLDAP